MKKRLLPLLCLAATFFLGAVAGAQKAEDNWFSDYLYQGSKLRSALGVQDNFEAQDEASKPFAKTLNESIGNRARTEQMARWALIQGDASTAQGRVTTLLQNQKIIEQNAQIIELLTKIAANK